MRLQQYQPGLEPCHLRNRPLRLELPALFGGVDAAGAPHAPTAGVAAPNRPPPPPLNAAEDAAGALVPNSDGVAPPPPNKSPASTSSTKGFNFRIHVV